MSAWRAGGVRSRRVRRDIRSVATTAAIASVLMLKNTWIRHRGRIAHPAAESPSTITTSNVISAVLASIRVAEQYFSFDSLTARST